MLTFWLFQTIPEIAPQVVLIEDARQRNHRNNAKTRQNMESNMSRWVQLPAEAALRIDAHKVGTH